MPATRAKPTADPGETLTPAGARVLRRFRIVFNSVRSHFRAVERKTGLTGAQAWALSVIRDHPGIGVGGLAKAMDIHQSTASNLLRPLLARGLVVSDRAGTDKRVVRLQVSAEALKLLRKVPGPYAGVLPEALDRLDEVTLQRLDRDLGRLIQVLGANEAAGNLPLGQPQ